MPPPPPPPPSPPPPLRLSSSPGSHTGPNSARSRRAGSLSLGQRPSRHTRPPLPPPPPPSPCPPLAATQTSENGVGVSAWDAPHQPP
eukprot:139139-Chlamydomonas_euryale.AAC.1